MINFKIPRLSLLLVFIVIFSSTCTTSTAQPLSDPTVTSTIIAIPEVTSAGTTEVTPGVLIETTPEITPTAYLPLVERPNEKFLGIYLDYYWDNKNIANLTQADQGTGKKHTSVGWFINLEDVAFTKPITYLPGNNLYSQLEELWKAGYTSFVNIGTSATAVDIINGLRDSEIGYAAEFYKAWIDQGGGRIAMIAPMQEMNGMWTAYGAASTSDEFKLAYRHIFDIFAEKGITRKQVWWVFAPNGYNDKDKPERAFENYYPGDDVVDIVGFSSYNYGYCPDTAPYWRWESYPQIFEPYIARMQVMAPTKPIIIAETSSTPYSGVDGEGNPVIDYNQMNQWLIENYNYFADRAGVIGIFYFSFPEFDGYVCKIEINPNGTILSGYAVAASNRVYKYLTADKLDSLIR
jgi:hypothetical protein